MMTRSRFMESFLQDLEIGARVLVKEKGFCALAVASVTIGICAVTTVFAIVNGVLIRGLAFPQAGQLVDVRLDDPTSIVPRGYITTMADFADLKAAQTTCAAFVAYDEDTFNLSTKSYAQRQAGTYVSHDFFRTLGVTPALGRDFLPDDDRAGAAPAVILSDSLWRSDFAGDPGVIGQSLRINGGAGTIVGVMPPGLNFPGKSQLWVPINTQYAPRPRGDPDPELIKIIARLKPGVAIEQAEAEIAALARRLAAHYPENKSSRGAVQPLARAQVSPWLTHLIWSMLAFSVGVLLIACGNVMNMQFARATLRAKELAIRSSLGATRVRLVRQMLTESLLLAMIGSALGVAFAYWATARLDEVFHSFRYSLDSWITFAIDTRVLALAVGLTALATLLSGLLPALVASRPNVMVLLKESGRGSTGRLVNRVTRILVVGQIAASCVLLIGSLIKAQSIIRGQNVAYGYDTGSILSGNMNLMAGDYPTNESRVFFYEKLLRQLRATPAIKSAALTSRFQMVFAGWGERIEIESRSYQNDADRPVTQLERISDGYWAITGQRLVEGRDFSPEDNDVREPVAIVNETLAKKHFGRDSPVGHRFRMVRNNGQEADRWRTIVGVVSDVLMLVPANVKNDNAGFYLPFNATIYANGPPVIAAPEWATVILTLQGGARPESYEASLRQAVARVDPNLPLYYIDTPRTNLAIAFSLDRVIAQLFTIFSGIAMLLTAVGFYGMAAYSVNQRTQEFGIRLALGADRRSLISLVLREGAWQLGLGLALGLATALLFSFAAEDWISSLVLIHIGPRDPPTYLAVVLMFVIVSLAATIVPAWRAARVDPMVALRAE